MNIQTKLNLTLDYYVLLASRLAKAFHETENDEAEDQRYAIGNKHLSAAKPVDITNNEGYDEHRYKILQEQISDIKSLAAEHGVDISDLATAYKLIYDTLNDIENIEAHANNLRQNIMGLLDQPEQTQINITERMYQIQMQIKVTNNRVRVAQYSPA